jgi:hypothetical protein
MKHSIGITLILIFLTSCGKAPEKKAKNDPVIETQVIELSYFNDVTVTDVLNVINKHQLHVHEKNAPTKVKISNNLIMKQNYFTDFYRKKDGDYECDISISGLNDNLGSLSVVVRNFRLNHNKNKMVGIFNNLVSSLPQNLFPATIKGTNLVESFSQNLKSSGMKGIFGQTINGVEYQFIFLDTEISLEIAKEGN